MPKFQPGDMLRFIGEPHPDRSDERRHLGGEEEGDTDETRQERADRGVTRSPIAIDSLGRYEEFVRAEVDGVGSHDEDHHAISFANHGVAYDADGNPRLIEQRRIVSFTDAQVKDQFKVERRAKDEDVPATPADEAPAPEEAR